VQYLKFEPVPLQLNTSIESGDTPAKKRTLHRVNSMRRRSWSDVAYKLNPDLPSPPMAAAYDEQSSPNTSAAEDSDSASEDRRSPVLAVTPVTFPLLPGPRPVSPEEVISFIDRIKAAKRYFGALSDTASSPPTTAAASCDDGATTAPTTEAASVPVPFILDLSASGPMTEPPPHEPPSTNEDACADDACKALLEHTHACDETELPSRGRQCRQATPIAAVLVAVALLVLTLPLLFMLPHVQQLPSQCQSPAAIRTYARQLLPWVTRQPWLRPHDGVLL